MNLFKTAQRYTKDKLSELKSEVNALRDENNKRINCLSKEVNRFSPNSASNEGIEIFTIEKRPTLSDSIRQIEFEEEL